MHDNSLKPGEADDVEAIFYTDPLCCWSWAMEPQWRKLQFLSHRSLRVRYKMIGLLPSWELFHDASHSLRKPIHMGPEWVHARELSGMPVADGLWVSDPPVSSFPACIAVKSAEAQSAVHGARYLRLLRQAVMQDARNIAETAVLLDAATLLAREDRDFDSFEFRDCLLGDMGKDLFRQDYQQAQYLGIRRSPTIVFTCGGKSLRVQGYTDFSALQGSLERLVPGMIRPDDGDETTYRTFWGAGLTDREVQEYLFQTHSESRGVRESASSFFY